MKALTFVHVSRYALGAIMTIERTDTEPFTLIRGLLKHICRSIQTQHKNLIDLIKRQFPRENLPFRGGKC